PRPPCSSCSSNYGSRALPGRSRHLLDWRYDDVRQVGLMDMHKNERIGPILASVANDYRRQITYPDRVHIGVRITRIGRSSMDMEHKIFSQNDHALAAEGTSTLVVFDYQTNKSCPVPARIRHAVENLEGRRSEARPPRRSIPPSYLLCTGTSRFSPATRRPFHSTM